MEKLLLTEEEARKALGLGRTKLYELLMAGEIESVKIGKCRRIRADALQTWLERMRQEQGAA